MAHADIGHGLAAYRGVCGGHAIAQLHRTFHAKEFVDGGFHQQRVGLQFLALIRGHTYTRFRHFE